MNYFFGLLCTLLLTARSLAGVPAVAGELNHRSDHPSKGKSMTTSGATDARAEWPQPPKAPPGAPNIVLILLDDVGFAATSTFGGTAATPVLDRLAARGLRYNNFHTTALCSPTRAALLTGRNDHRAGFGSIMEGVSGFPGYNGIWKKTTVSVAEVLRRNGYSTAAFGKWHNTPYWEISPVGPFDRWPTNLGFEYFYGFQGGAQSQWEPHLYRNTAAVEPPATPAQGYHFTTDITDEAIRWVQTYSSLVPDKPYFLYFATGATHEPHHVPKDWIAKYRGEFDQGWDKLREEIFSRQKALGVIPADAELTPRPAELPAWDSLSADKKKLYARQMEIYAGFLAHTDHEVGRLLQVVAEGPHGDNTLILYIVGDNGGSGEGGIEGRDVPPEEIGLLAPPVPVQTRLQHLDELGSELFINNYSAAWAWATGAPFQWMKQVASHYGGTTNPLIVVWPARIKDHGGLRTQFAHVNDVAPTLYELTGIRFPTVVDGIEQLSLDGTSLAYTFDNPQAPSRHRTQLFEQVGSRAIYHDGWVAAARHSVPWDWHRSADFAYDRWELYHVAEDYSEAHDLSAQFPAKLKSLQSLFDSEARRNLVYPLNTSFGGPLFGPGQPSLTAGRYEFVYHSGLRVPINAVPSFAGSHRLTAEVVIPESGAQGVIVAEGGRAGGFSWYVKDNRLVYENNFQGRKYELIVSRELVPHGKVELAYEFVRSDAQAGHGGTGRLYFNGRIVGEAPLTHYAAPSFFDIYFDSFSVGQAAGAPVSSAYDVPFPFTGTLGQLRVELK